MSLPGSYSETKTRPTSGRLDGDRDAATDSGTPQLVNYIALRPFASPASLICVTPTPPAPCPVDIGALRGRESPDRFPECPSPTILPSRSGHVSHMRQTRLLQKSPARKEAPPLPEDGGCSGGGALHGSFRHAVIQGEHEWTACTQFTILRTPLWDIMTTKVSG
ncbi:hypothetical protein VUR80DRAFT_2587 [Thermomyces stellatus]